MVNAAAPSKLYNLTQESDDNATQPIRTKKNHIYLTRDPFKFTFMNIQLEHASISDKKDQLVCPSYNEGIIFLSCAMTYGIAYMIRLSVCVIRMEPRQDSTPKISFIINR